MIYSIFKVLVGDQGIKPWILDVSHPRSNDKLSPITFYIILVVFCFSLQLHLMLM
jgi:hypothetical protein